jgi:hypothetical protein
LPAPATDLLDQGDQLANLLRKHLVADGSVNVSPTGGDETLNAEAVRHYAGPALYGIIRSQHLRPADWKLEALRQARAYYHACWKQDRNVAMTAWYTAAYTEAYLLTRDRRFVDSVFEMNDWLCGLQYQQVDAARAAWFGGFAPAAQGQTAPLAPEISSAEAVASLVEACRLARAAGDVQHYQRYRQAVENGLQFLTTLQYAEANTQHFADWYRPNLIGAFYASRQDGNVRLEYVAQALSALVQYLHYVADVP